MDNAQKAMSGIPIFRGDAIKELIEGKTVVYSPSQEVILKKGLEIEDKELRALYYGSYQTGGRISEMLPMKFGDVTEVSYDRHRYAEVRLLTLKNRKKGLRYIPIPLYIPMENQMFAYFKEVYDARVNLIFKDVGSRNSVWDKFHRNISFNCEVLDLKTKKSELKEVPLHPHLLRHFRLSHLVTIYQYNAFQLQDFAGWSDVRQASTYVSLGSKQLANQFALFNHKT